jgi:hypothetical protein
MLWTRELCSESERQQNEEKDNPNAGIEPRTFCYPGRCPKSIRLEGTSYLRLRLMITLDHNIGNVQNSNIILNFYFNKEMHSLKYAQSVSIDKGINGKTRATSCRFYSVTFDDFKEKMS